MSSPTDQRVSVASTSPEDWKYVSEGGATIVFSYRGPPHPDFSDTVLRLRKSHRKLNYDHDDDYSHPVGKPLTTESVLSEGDDEPDDPSISFQQKVTSQLIAQDFLPRLEAVHVEQSWLESLKATSEKDRPLQRRDKDEIDVHRRKAVLATDLVGGDFWAVEIKPKWGFMPNPEFLSPETRKTKLRHCRFCLHTRYRKERGETTSQGYCPLDLFSGNPERVSHAVWCLWKAWVASNGTVNNLKIFARGELVVPEEASEKLGHFLSGKFNGSGGDYLMEAFADALLPLLTGTPVLRRIAQLQRSLDPLDIEGLQTLHATSPTHETPIEELFPEPSLDDWERFVEKYKSQHPITNLDAELLQHYAMAYLLSATFKDCSIILRLGRGPEVPDSITVIDLDPKDMKRLKTWAELDRNIAMAFVGDESRLCHEELSSATATNGE